VRLYPEDWKQKLGAVLEAFMSFGLLAACFYVGFPRSGTPIRKIQLILFELIVFYAFSFGFALSACRQGKRLARVLGVVMMCLLAYLLMSIAQAHGRGRM
jgi:hypothetical protein